MVRNTSYRAMTLKDLNGALSVTIIGIDKLLKNDHLSTSEKIELHDRKKQTEFDLKIVQNELCKYTNNYGAVTLSELGKVLGVSRERVRQIEASAIKKLKNPLVGRKLKQYLDIDLSRN